MTFSITKISSIVTKTVKYGLIITLTFLVAYALFLIYNSSRLPALQPWHLRDAMDDVLTRKDYPDFQSYLDAEKQYINRIYKEVAVSPSRLFNRYAKDNPSSPYIDGKNLNASFQMFPQGEAFKGGVLLVHGLTDSPYHIRSAAELFSRHGYYVIGLRLPGHGTVPGALRSVEWQDWYQAVRFAANYVQKEIDRQGGGRFYAGGFSTGGALVLHYTLQGLVNGAHRVPDKLLFLSPAIGVMPAAKIANLHNILSWMPWFEKLAWMDIQPEYDPFKYNSMPFNAGYQIYALTQENWALVEALRENPKRLSAFPDMYAFQSLVDATVVTKELGVLFSEIASDKSRILLFGVNHRFDTIISEEVARFGIDDIAPENLKNKILFLSNEIFISADTDTPIQQTLITDYASRKKIAFETNWPKNVFALSHVAVPIAPDDPVYGRNSALGGLNVKGEYDVLAFGVNFMRLRYNPFWDIVQKYIMEWFQLQLSPQ